MSNELGKSIKRLRTSQEFTQKQLAEGICSQSMLSRVEQGLEIPSVLIIHNICQKLGITVDSLLSLSQLDSPLIQLKKELHQLYVEHDYEILYTHLHKKTLAMFEINSQESHYYFYLGVCELKYKNNNQNGITALEYAFSLSKSHSDQALISSYLAATYYATSNEIAALKHLNHCLLFLNKQDFSSEFLPAIYFHVALCYGFVADNLTAIEYIHLGIDCCKRQTSNFYLTYLFFELGVLFIRTNRKQTGIRKIKFSLELSAYLDEQFITAELSKRRKEDIEYANNHIN
ncbi:helix-turn-helix domain-containing protein [Listeria grandensis]|uniref:helix-turn-helix domain-containing protein n=1 Tax=Listeria grandensis TaxID=1494963 RepID=UPI00164DD7A2|nr:helix-turn-helix transcriptional regulator [Listeria grandensis]MBC6316644.1 helix-turn-helix transcriptional regulator [Listeria grandensis]